MPFTVFTLAMLLICIFCIGKETFNGFARGPLRALLSLCVVVLSIICSIFISYATSGIFTKMIMENVVDEFIKNNVSMLAGFLSVHETASYFIQAILAGCIFALAFPIFKGIANALIAIIVKHRLKRLGTSFVAESKQDKLLGSIVGGLCGIITAIVVIAPIMGTVHVLSDTVKLVDNISKKIPEDQNIVLPELEPMDLYAKDAVGNFCYTIGGELIYRNIAVGEFEEKTLSVIDEIKHIERTSEFAADIVGAFWEENDSLDFSKSADGLYENFEKSEILRNVSLEIISDFSFAWMNGENFLGTQIPDFNDDFKPMVYELLIVGTNINEYNIMPTAKTLLNIVGVLLDCNITVDSKTAEVDYYLLAPKLCLALADNPDMENARLKLENAAVIAIADWVGANMSQDERAAMTTAIANDITQIFGDVAEPQARLEAIDEKLLAKFGEFGLAIDPSFCELFAHKLIKITENNYGQLSQQDVEALLDQNRGGLAN